MATFVIGQPISTTVPFVTVDAGLPVGRPRFQLEVVTSDRRGSKPDVAVVEVIGRIPVPTGTVTTGTFTRTLSGGGTATGVTTPIAPLTGTTVTRPDIGE